MKCKVEISGRHIHLSESDFKILFGNIKPTEIKELSQKDIACEETVEVKGEKNKISNVRVLIPFREFSQLEISKTDAINLGVDAPLKISGERPGTGIKVKGPAGEIEKEIAIVAKRHLHLSQEEAAELNLHQGDHVSLKIDGIRGLTFDQIIVRVKDIYSKSIHLDTDEANAAGLNESVEGELIINNQKGVE